MYVGEKKTTNHIKGFKQEIQKASKRKSSDFFNWFNNAGGDVDANFNKGQVEFTNYVLLPLMRQLKNAHKKTALEIGHGGGRLLYGAAKTFNKVIGVDIHDNNDLVEKELIKRNVKNFTLIKGDGKSLPVKDDSVDVVFSFIVLQHIEKISILKAYIKETYRVLKKGGFAVLFFGRMYEFSTNTNIGLLYQVDNILENLNSKGYRELFQRVNYTNLQVSRKYAKQLCGKAGFSVIHEGISKKLPDYKRYGGQQFLVLQK